MIVANDNLTRQRAWARLRAWLRRPSMVEEAARKQEAYRQARNDYRVEINLGP